MYNINIISTSTAVNITTTAIINYSFAFGSLVIIINNKDGGGGIINIIILPRLRLGLIHRRRNNMILPIVSLRSTSLSIRWWWRKRLFYLAPLGTSYSLL